MWGAAVKEVIKPEIEIANSQNFLGLFHLSVRSRMPILVEIRQLLSKLWQIK